MATGKNNSKATAGYNILAEIAKKAVDRWTSKSPKAAVIATNVALGVGIAATIVTLIPVTYPAWVLPVTAFAIALTSKFTKE